ncbi:MAG TPA: ferritin-like domain-containing protein [Solirubrobacterales bacterium]|nr:ferritin-like domain-containing protein [Solirubrobacterales bacterium]
MAGKRIIFAAAAALALLAGCGGGGASSTAQEKAADVKLLNEALGAELTAVNGFTAGLPLLSGTPRTLAEQLRAQAQEHVDALSKSIRGLGGSAAPQPSALETSTLKSPDDFYAFAYELENSTIASHMSAIPKLAGSHLRVLFASIVADEAQQQVLLRHALGAGPRGLVPDAFETGASPAPGEESRAEPTPAAP